MHAQTIIRPGGRPTATNSRHRTTLGITAEILVDVRQRARRLSSGVLAMSIVLGVPWTLIIAFSERVGPGIDFMPYVAGVGALSSLLVWLFARSERGSNEAVLYVCLAYIILGCGMTGVVHAAHEFQRHGHLTAFGPYAIFICGAPLVLVTPPRLTIWTTGLASLAVLTGIFTAHTLGYAQVLLPELVEITAVLFACSLVGYISNRTIFGLHREVARARRLGSYELIERVGAGGMGEVWRAKHNMLARPAAVKLIQAENFRGDNLGLESAVQRFSREAQATAALESAHTIRLFDFGQSDEGTFYYAMELLDGINLDDLVRSHGPVPSERVHYILLQACDSIAEAHAHGLVHRDIKPGNVMICRKGRALDFVKVLDFGLVTLQEEMDLSATSEERLTEVGQIVGTVGFMAPEALMGSANSASSDIYALGCLAFWLLSGRRVFKGRTPKEIAMAHILEDAPSLRALDTQDVPEALEALIAACLSRDPKDRPRSVDRLIEALQAITFEDPWTQKRAERWWASNKSPASPIEIEVNLDTEPTPGMPAAS